MQFKDFYIIEGKEFKTIKDNKIPLTDEERDDCMKAKAVWHPENHDIPCCAIWKSKGKDGKIVYGSNTHRCYQTSNTLKGAIKKFHEVVKETA
jgi:hypothetical protein